jgi:acyl-coenzyme A synthetase/AMP-(fatty) acid ligase
VVTEPGSGLTEDAVKAYALNNGPAYAHPRRVFILTEIPLTGTNKIDRTALRAIGSNA